MKVPASFHPPGTTTHVVCDDADVVAAVFVALAGDFIFTTSTIGGWIEIRTSESDRIREMVKAWAQHCKVEVEEDMPGSFVRVGQDSWFNPKYHKPRSIVITGLDAPMPSDPAIIVLALGEVTRGDFTGSIVTSAPATEDDMLHAPTWLIGPPKGRGHRTLFCPTLNRSETFSANLKQCEIVFPEGSYRFESMVVRQPSTRADRVVLKGEEKIDLYRRVLALRLYAATGFMRGYGGHRKTYSIRRTFGPLEGTAWPTMREIIDLHHEHPDYMDRLSARVPTVNGILKSAKILGMVGKWTPVNPYVRLKLERDHELGRGHEMRLIVERRPEAQAPD